MSCEENVCDECPWWSNKFGLRQFIAQNINTIHSNDISPIKKKKMNDFLDLSFWPIKDEDLVIVVDASNRYITRLSFHGCIDLTNSGIAYLSNHWATRLQNQFLPSLTSLDLSGCVKINDLACKSISIFLRLESINLSDCSKITDCGIQLIMERCKYLEEIRFRNLFRLQDEGMSFIIRNLVVMKRLRIIDLSGCIGFSNEALINLFESDPGIIRNIDVSNTNIELGLIGIKKHHITNKCMVIKMANLPRVLDSMLEWIATGCKYLQCIDLTGSRDIHDFGVCSLLQSCRRLKAINLSHCTQISDGAFDCMDPHFVTGSSIRKINLSHCYKITSKSLKKVALTCSELTHLTLEGVSKVCDEGIVQLASNCHLEELDLSVKSLGNSSFSNIPRVGPRGAIAVGKFCPNLLILRLDSCSRIDNISMSVLAKGCKRVAEISIRRCYLLGDKCLNAIGKHCRHLRRITLSSCKEISDDGLQNLAAGCQDLVEIDLSNLLVTDRGIYRLCHYCRGLVTVILRNCYRITDSSLLRLFQQCHLLENIDLRGIDLLTNDVFKSCHLSRLRYADTRGSNISKDVLHALGSKSLYSTNDRNDKNSLRLIPLYSSREVHQKHHIYLIFLHKQANIIKACLLRFNSKMKRKLSVAASIKIQTAAKYYRIRKLRAQECELNRKINSSNIIIACARGAITRKHIAKRKKAMLTVQCLVRAYQARKKSESLLLERKKSKAEEFVRSRENHGPQESSPSCTTIIWRNLTIRLALFESSTKVMIIRRIQKIWRLKLRLIFYQKRNLAERIRRWMLSLVRIHKIERRKYFVGALLIQRTWRRLTTWNIIISGIRRESQEIKYRKAAGMYIAIFFQCRWRSKKCQCLLKQMRKEHLRNLVLCRASSKVQLWYRYHKAKRVLYLKKKVTGRWHLLVQERLKRERARAAAIIKSWLLHCQKEYERSNAASIIASSLSTMFQRCKIKRASRAQRQLDAIRRLQEWWRIKIQRLRFLSTIRSVSKFQRAWRATRCRRILMVLYKEEQARRRLLEIEEKEALRKKQRERQIIALFAKTKGNAALTIQSCFREYCKVKNNRERVQFEEELMQKKQQDEEARLNEIIKRKQDSRKLKNIAKIYVKSAASKLSNGIKNLSIEAFRYQRREITKRKNLAPRLLYHALKRTLVKKKSHLGVRAIPYNAEVSEYQNTLEILFKDHRWFNKECEKLMFRYLLWPEEVLSVRRIWTDSLDFKQEECIGSIDFFDHIRQPISKYGLWLYNAVQVDTESITFSQYLKLIAHISLLSKQELLKLIFYSSTSKSLSKNAWDNLVETLLSEESVHPPRRLALRGFDKFSVQDVHGNSVLYFEEFSKITNCYPWLISGIVRLVDNVKIHHLGEGFWRSKREELEAAYHNICAEIDDLQV